MDERRALFLAHLPLGGSQRHCIGAAMSTLLSIKSHSPHSTTASGWRPTRDSMRFSEIRLAWRSAMPLCASIAQRTVSIALRNVTIVLSPARSTIWR